MVTFDPRQFERFARKLTIESKDEGLVPLKFRGSQIEMLKGISNAVANDQHIIKILKSRQLGASTMCLGLDLYWSLAHPGTHGALITDTDSNRESFRVTLDAMIGNSGKQKNPEIIKHNRDHMVFKNRSRLIYQVAGTRDGGNLARGKGLNYCHATEVSSWGNPDSVDSLTASFSEKNAFRLYIFESTARGFNLWYDMCREAQKSRSQAFLFVTWWHSPEFCFNPGDNEYRVYADMPPDASEREWMEEIRKLHGHEITPGQLAWWRWMKAERGYDEATLNEEFPLTAERAWVMTGSQFFSTRSLTNLMVHAKTKQAHGYTYRFGESYDTLKKEHTNADESHFLVWEEPEDGAYYAIGADPCGGTGSMLADDAVIEVMRCYGDGLEQAAEFRFSGIPGYLFAWALADIARMYHPCIVNLEINGSGIAVADELNRIRFEGSYYVYRRSDSLGGGGALHWRTTNDTKRWVMEQMRTFIERQMIGVYSEEAVSQMRKIEQDGIYVGGSSRMTGDDCVMAMAIAIEAYAKNYMETLQAMGSTRPKHGSSTSSTSSVLQADIRGMLRSAGLVSPETAIESAYGESVYIPDNEEF